MLSRKMSMVEWDPGAEPGVEESPGSNSPGDPGTLKGAMVVFSLASDLAGEGVAEKRGWPRDVDAGTSGVRRGGPP